MLSNSSSLDSLPVAGDGPSRVIVNPVSGERIVVRESGRDTDGRLFAFDLYLPEGAHVPAGHTHPGQEERFTVVAGRMRFRLGRRAILAGPGDSVVIASGTPHWFGNAGPDVAQARVEVRPALRMEEFFAATEAMAETGHIPGTRLPWPPALARLLLEFEAEVATPYLPRWLERNVLRLLARLGAPAPKSRR